MWNRTKNRNWNGRYFHIDSQSTERKHSNRFDIRECLIQSKDLVCCVTLQFHHPGIGYVTNCINYWILSNRNQYNFYVSLWVQVIAMPLFIMLDLNSIDSFSFTFLSYSMHVWRCISIHCELFREFPGFSETRNIHSNISSPFAKQIFSHRYQIFSISNVPSSICLCWNANKARAGYEIRFIYWRMAKLCNFFWYIYLANTIYIFDSWTSEWERDRAQRYEKLHNWANEPFRTGLFLFSLIRVSIAFYSKNKHSNNKQFRWHVQKFMPQLLSSITMEPTFYCDYDLLKG